MDRSLFSDVCCKAAAQRRFDLTTSVSSELRYVRFREQEVAALRFLSGPINPVLAQSLMYGFSQEGLPLRSLTRVEAISLITAAEQQHAQSLSQSEPRFVDDCEKLEFLRQVCAGTQEVRLTQETRTRCAAEALRLINVTQPAVESVIGSIWWNEKLRPIAEAVMGILGHAKETSSSEGGCKALSALFEHILHQAEDFGPPLGNEKEFIALSLLPYHVRKICQELVFHSWRCAIFKRQLEQSPVPEELLETLREKLVSWSRGRALTAQDVFRIGEKGAIPERLMDWMLGGVIAAAENSRKLLTLRAEHASVLDPWFSNLCKEMTAIQRRVLNELAHFYKGASSIRENGAVFSTDCGHLMQNALFIHGDIISQQAPQVVSRTPTTSVARVLLLEDSEPQQMALQSFFQSRPEFCLDQSEIFSDPAVFCRYIKGRDLHKVGVIILDLQQPSDPQGGLTALREILANPSSHNAPMTIILWSASGAAIAEVEKIWQGQQTGVLGTLSVPYLGTDSPGTGEGLPSPRIFFYEKGIALHALKVLVKSVLKAPPSEAQLSTAP
jgi:hypothetical protein